jgi:hypothetical protein
MREGRERFQLVNVPSSIEPLLHPRSYCSLLCIRADFLETLAEFEWMASPGAQSTVTDLRSTYIYLTRAFADLMFGPQGATA